MPDSIHSGAIRSTAMHLVGTSIGLAMVDPKTQAEKDFDRRMHEGERAHDRNDAYVARMNEVVSKDATATIRILLLINGGAAVSILAFVGNALSKTGPASLDIDHVVWSMMLFGTGVAAATLASGLSYVTNFLKGHQQNTAKRTWEHPYIVRTKQSLLIGILAALIHFVAISCAILSLVLFACGMWKMKDAILIGSPKPQYQEVKTRL